MMPDASTFRKLIDSNLAFPEFNAVFTADVRTLYEAGLSRDDVRRILSDVRIQYLDEGLEEDDPPVVAVLDCMDGIDRWCHRSYWVWPEDLDGREEK